jgi:hypothetical protein
VDLGGGQIAFAHVLQSPLFAFYDLCAPNIPQIDKIVAAPIAFKIWVMKHAVTDGIWPVIGHVPILDMDEAPKFFKRDRITGALSITCTGAEEEKATLAECLRLECAAVWDPRHVTDRLRDHFAGRPNKWVESMRPPAL